MDFNMLIDAIFAFMATVCFGVLVNIRGKMLVFSAFNGGITWLIYLLLQMEYGAPILSLFIASLFAAAYSEIMARILKAPVTLFVICGIIPLVPGSGMYKTMLYTIQGQTNLAVSEGMSTVGAAGSIAVGIFVISIFVSIISFWKNKFNVDSKN